MHDLKGTIPNMPAFDNIFKNARFKGRKLDQPFVHEIVRPAKVSEFDYQTKTVTLEWLDNPGTQFSVLMSYPIVGRDWGIYSMPYINDLCLCAIEGGRVRILTWIPRNASMLRYVEPGEIMLESSGHATVYVRNFPKEALEKGGFIIDSVIHMTSSEDDSQLMIGKSIHTSKVEESEGGTKYLYQATNSASDETTQDEKGNELSFVSGTATRVVGDEWMEVANTKRTMMTKEDHTLSVVKNCTEQIKKKFTLEAKEVSIGSSQTCDINSGSMMSISASGSLSLKSSFMISINAPIIMINSGGGGAGSAGFSGLGQKALDGLASGDIMKSLPGSSNIGSQLLGSSSPVSSFMSGGLNAVTNSLTQAGMGMVNNMAQSALSGGGMSGVKAAMGSSISGFANGVVNGAVNGAMGAVMGGINNAVSGPMNKLSSGLNNVTGKAMGAAGRLGGSATQALGGGKIGGFAGNMIGNMSKSVVSGGMNMVRRSIGKTVGRTISKPVSKFTKTTSEAVGRFNNSTTKTVQKVF